MNLDQAFLLKALLSHNYLPTQRRAREEVPPIFSTETFTVDVALELDKLPTRQANGGPYTGYDQVEYRLTRFNSVARLLSIPHPLPHSKLCLTIYENWQKIEELINNPNSYVKPQQYSDGRILIMNGYNDSVENASRHISHAFGKNYQVKTDIANCFSSIYSHAVPWALVGHEEAKIKKGPKHASEWFNIIDKNLRSCRRDETQGVAIGPATSNIICEIIFAPIDQALRDAGFTFTRFVDDYTCHCQTEDDAEKFVRILEHEAAKYKLQLNIIKTDIRRLPQPTHDSWVVELGHRVPPEKVVSAYSAFQFLDFALDTAAKYPNGSVLKYAANTLAGKNFNFGDKLDVLKYLLVLAFQQPALLPSLEKFINSGFISHEDQKIDLVGATEKIGAIASENARLRRSDGMSWALYYLGKTGSTVSESIASDIINKGDALAIMTLYWTGQHKSAVKSFSENLDTEDLYLLDRYWPLLYQLYRDGVISNPYKDEVFDALKAGGVSLFSPNLKPGTLAQ